MRRTPQQSRLLGLWTATWLFVLLVGLLLRVGDPRLQWPVLLVPVGWALVAWRRGRRGRPAKVRRPEDEEPGPPEVDEPGPPEVDEPWPPEDDAWPPDDESPP